MTFESGDSGVGDAAGLAHSCSGEGILPAIESGLLAAETVLAARGRYDASGLEPYRHAVAQRLGRRRPPAGSRLPTWLTELVGRRLLAARWTTRAVLRRRPQTRRCATCIGGGVREQADYRRSLA